MGQLRTKSCQDLVGRSSSSSPSNSSIRFRAQNRSVFFSSSSQVSVLAVLSFPRESDPFWFRLGRAPAGRHGRCVLPVAPGCAFHDLLSHATFSPWAHEPSRRAPGLLLLPQAYFHRFPSTSSGYPSPMVSGHALPLWPPDRGALAHALHRFHQFHLSGRHHFGSFALLSIAAASPRTSSRSPRLSSSSKWDFFVTLDTCRSCCRGCRHLRLHARSDVILFDLLRFILASVDFRRPPLRWPHRGRHGFPLTLDTCCSRFATFIIFVCASRSTVIFLLGRGSFDFIYISSSSLPSIVVASPLAFSRSSRLSSSSKWDIFVTLDTRTHRCFYFDFIVSSASRSFYRQPGRCTSSFTFHDDRLPPLTFLPLRISALIQPARSLASAWTTSLHTISALPAFIL